MKKLLFFFSLLLLTVSLYAQTSGGPDNYGYIWRDSNDPNGPAFNWIDVRNNPATEFISGLSDDNTVGPFPLPAPFPYYWYTQSNFKIGSNGYLAFGNGSFASPFPTIPFANTNNNVLAAMMSDLNFENTGAQAGNPAKCYIWKSPSQDSVVVTFDSVPFWVNGVPAYQGLNTFQIILDYNDSSITYQYLIQNGTVSPVAGVDFMTIGIENVSGTDGLQYSHDQYPVTNYAIKFYAPSSTTQQITDASTLYNQNESTGAVFISRNAFNGYPLNTTIKNEGNITLNPFTVNVQVINAANQIQLNNNLTSDTLQAGQTQSINLPNPFLPINAGTYRFTTTTIATGDLSTLNNARTLEMIVVDTTLPSITLAYDNGVSSATGISWSGGNGACANYFIPPFYPCDLTSVAAYIISDVNAVGYRMKVYADDGVNGAPGTLLDSISVLPGTFTTGAFVNTTLTAPIRVDSGGFYVMWDMGGDGVTLGTNLVFPYSNRGYEVLGGTWSVFRSSETQDLMIRANISRVGVGIEENELENAIGEFFPNPTSDLVSIRINNASINTSALQTTIYDLSGRIVQPSVRLTGNDVLQINTAGLEAGLYTARFISGDNAITRKFTVIK
jgi:hypothetical protein